MATADSQLLDAIPALVAKLHGGSKVGRARATKALCTLAALPECRDAMRATGGIMPALVAQLGDSSAVIQDAAAELLALLLEDNPGAQAAAIAAGVAPQLVALVKGSSGGSGFRCSSPGVTGPSSSSSGTSVQLQGLSAMNQLVASNEAGAAALQAAGGVEAVLQVMRSSWEGPQALVEAAAFLAQLPLGSLPRATAVVEAGGFGALVPLLSSDSSAVQLGAAWACHNLTCGSHANKVAAAAAGCVPPLLRLLRASTPARAQAASALLNLAAGRAPCLQALLNAGAALPLVDCLRSMHGAGSDGSDGQQGVGGVAYSLAGVLALMVSFGGAAAVGAAVGAAGGVEQLRELLLVHGGEVMRMSLDRVLSATTGQSSEASAEAAAAGATGRGGGAKQQEGEQAAEAAGSSPAGVEAAPVSAPPPVPKVCAAEGCGATRGLRRCGGCASVRYCTQACSRAHWPAHKAKCRRLQAAAAAAAAGPQEG